MFKKNPILRMAIKPPRRARPIRNESGYLMDYTTIFFCSLKSKLKVLMFETVVFYWFVLIESTKGPRYEIFGSENCFGNMVSYS
jgi:hypothetical protein